MAGQGRHEVLECKLEFQSVLRPEDPKQAHCRSGRQTPHKRSCDTGMTTYMCMHLCMKTLELEVDCGKSDPNGVEGVYWWHG